MFIRNKNVYLEINNYFKFCYLGIIKHAINNIYFKLKKLCCMRAFNLLNYVYAEDFFLSKNVNFKSRFAKKNMLI